MLTARNAARASDAAARDLAGDQRVQAEVDQRVEVGGEDDQGLVRADVGAAQQAQVDERERGVDQARAHRRDGIQRERGAPRCVPL